MRLVSIYLRNKKSSALNLQSERIQSRAESDEFESLFIAAMSLKAFSYVFMLITDDFSSDDLKKVKSVKYALDKDDEFSTERRSKSRELS